MFLTKVLPVVLGLGVAHVAAIPQPDSSVEKVYIKYVNFDEPASFETPLKECTNVNLPDKVEAYQLTTGTITCVTWPALDCAGEPNAQELDNGGGFLDPSQEVLSVECSPSSDIGVKIR